MAKRNSTSTSERSLKQRVEALEAEVAQIKGEVRDANGVPANAWRLAVEKYTGDEDLQSIFKEALKLREADRKRARRRAKK